VKSCSYGTFPIHVSDTPFQNVSFNRNAQRHRQTDIETEQTDDSTMPIADHITWRYDRL